MKTIYKYVLDAAAGKQDIEMPAGAEILSVQEQDTPFMGTLVLWALVNPDAHPVKYRFLKVTTGSAISDHPGKFIGTVQLHGPLNDSVYVLHVFQVRLVVTFHGEIQEI